MSPLASTLPSSNDGYVAAAYIVFFAVVLIYLAIMAIRLSRLERRVRELPTDTRQTEHRAGTAHEPAAREPTRVAPEPSQERETTV